MAEYILRMPDVGEGVVEAEVTDWEVAVGDDVREDQHIADIMTDKATVEITSPVTGRVLRLAVEEGAVLAVGAELIAFEVEAEATEEVMEAGEAADAADGNSESEPESESKPRPVAESVTAALAAKAAAASGAERKIDKSASGASGARVLASPAIRRRAQTAGIDLALVTSGGGDGRIRNEDLDAYIAASTPAAPASPEPVAAVTGEKLSGLRRVIARKMELAASSIPHFNYTEEIEVTALEALQERLNEAAGPNDARLNYLPFFMRALARLLPLYPQFNAHFDHATNSIERFSAIHFGIATHTDQGLKVPVLRDAAGKNLRQLNNELLRVTNSARDHSSPPAELGGSTITLSSLGKLGGITAAPIINYPEVAIIVFHKAELRPVVRGGEIVARRMMNISGAFDHRVIDGHDAALLLSQFKDIVEAADPDDF